MRPEIRIAARLSEVESTESLAECRTRFRDGKDLFRHTVDAADTGTTYEEIDAGVKHRREVPLVFRKLDNLAGPLDLLGVPVMGTAVGDCTETLFSSHLRDMHVL